MFPLASSDNHVGAQTDPPGLAARPDLLCPVGLGLSLVLAPHVVVSIGHDHFV